MRYNPKTAFDRTIHTTNAWLRELMQELGWQDWHCAYRALRAVLHALRDRLPAEEAAAFGAQLPMLVRGFYYEGWHPSRRRRKERTKEEFFAHIAQELHHDPHIDPEQATRGVFQVVARHLTPGEIQAVQKLLPAAIRSLWSEAYPSRPEDEIFLADEVTSWSGEDQSRPEDDVIVADQVTS
jgi:uncharacterized protein (DUF2267 family)